MSDDIHGNYWLSLGNTVEEADGAICELADNSVDAGATRIDIQFRGSRTGKGKFVIKDNGSGCDDLERMFMLGASDKAGDSSGRYGFGLKGSVAYFGRIIKVKSVRLGVERSLVWDTSKDIETGVWKAGLHVGEELFSDEPNGTTIEITSNHTPRTAGGSLDELIAQQLSPAIEKGIVVTYNGNELEPFEYKWSESVTVEDEVFGDKCVITAGIADSSVKTSHCGWHVRKNARVLKRYLNSKKGLGGNERILVRVKLIQSDHSKHEWQLDPVSKSFLADKDQYEELGSRIASAADSFVNSENDSKASARIDGIISSIGAGLNELLKKGTSFGGDDGGEDGSIHGGNSSGGGGQCDKGGKAGEGSAASDSKPGDKYDHRDPTRPSGIVVKRNTSEIVYSYRLNDGTLELEASRKFQGSGGDSVHGWRFAFASALAEYASTLDTELIKGLKYSKDEHALYITKVISLLKKAGV